MQRTSTVQRQHIPIIALAAVCGVGIVLGAWMLRGKEGVSVSPSAWGIDRVVQQEKEALGARSVSADEFARLLEGGMAIIDLRTPAEFDGGHLKGAQNLNVYDADFAARLAALDRTKSYGIYCRSGSRSSQTLARMRELGFTNVAELSGGIMKWAAQNGSMCTNC